MWFSWHHTLFVILCWPDAQILLSHESYQAWSSFMRQSLLQLTSKIFEWTERLSDREFGFSVILVLVSFWTTTHWEIDTLNFIGPLTAAGNTESLLIPSTSEPLLSEKQQRYYIYFILESPVHDVDSRRHRPAHTLVCFAEGLKPDTCSLSQCLSLAGEWGVCWHSWRCVNWALESVRCVLVWLEALLCLAFQSSPLEPVNLQPTQLLFSIWSITMLR